MRVGPLQAHSHPKKKGEFMETLKKCLFCGKTFIDKGVRQNKKFCSQSCYIKANYEKIKKYNREKYGKDKQHITCVVCGKFLPKCKHKYCSKECQRIARLKDDEPNICFVCGVKIPDRKYSLVKNYVIHEKCLCKTSFKVDPKRVWKGD